MAISDRPHRCQRHPPCGREEWRYFVLPVLAIGVFALLSPLPSRRPNSSVEVGRDAFASSRYGQPPPGHGDDEKAQRIRKVRRPDVSRCIRGNMTPAEVPDWQNSQSDPRLIRKERREARKCIDRTIGRDAYLQNFKSLPISSSLDSDGDKNQDADVDSTDTFIGSQTDLSEAEERFRRDFYNMSKNDVYYPGDRIPDDSELPTFGEPGSITELESDTTDQYLRQVRKEHYEPKWKNYTLRAMTRLMSEQNWKDYYFAKNLSKTSGMRAARRALNDYMKKQQRLKESWKAFLPTAAPTVPSSMHKHLRSEVPEIMATLGSSKRGEVTARLETDQDVHKVFARVRQVKDCFDFLDSTMEDLEQKTQFVVYLEVVKVLKGRSEEDAELLSFRQLSERQKVRLGKSVAVIRDAVPGPIQNPRDYQTMKHMFIGYSKAIDRLEFIANRKNESVLEVWDKYLNADMDGIDFNDDNMEIEDMEEDNTEGEEAQDDDDASKRPLYPDLEYTDPVFEDQELRLEEEGLMTTLGQDDADERLPWRGTGPYVGKPVRVPNVNDRGNELNSSLGFVYRYCPREGSRYHDSKGNPGALWEVVFTSGGLKDTVQVMNLRNVRTYTALGLYRFFDGYMYSKGVPTFEARTEADINEAILKNNKHGSKSNRTRRCSSSKTLPLKSYYPELPDEDFFGIQDRELMGVRLRDRHFHGSGHPAIGLRIVRARYDHPNRDMLYHGYVLGFSPPSESNYTDVDGNPARLWRVSYLQNNHETYDGKRGEIDDEELADCIWNRLLHDDIPHFVRNDSEPFHPLRKPLLNKPIAVVTRDVANREVISSGHVAGYFLANETIALNRESVLDWVKNPDLMPPDKKYPRRTRRMAINTWSRRSLLGHEGDLPDSFPIPRLDSEKFFMHKTQEPGRGTIVTKCPKVGVFFVEWTAGPLRRTVSGFDYSETLKGVELARTRLNLTELRPDPIEYGPHTYEDYWRYYFNKTQYGKCPHSGYGLLPDNYEGQVPKYFFSMPPADYNPLIDLKVKGKRLDADDVVFNARDALLGMEYLKAYNLWKSLRNPKINLGLSPSAEVSTVAATCAAECSCWQMAMEIIEKAHEEDGLQIGHEAYHSLLELLIERNLTDLAIAYGHKILPSSNIHKDPMDKLCSDNKDRIPNVDPTIKYTTGGDDYGALTSPQSFIYQQIRNAYLKQKRWQEAIQLLHRQKDNRVPVEMSDFEDPISYAASSHAWAHALELLRSVAKTFPEKPKASMFVQVLTGMSERGRWENAIKLMRSMRKVGYRLDTTCYTQAIRACNVAKAWQNSLLLVNHMKLRGIFRDEDCYAHAVQGAQIGRSNVWISKLREDAYRLSFDPLATQAPEPWALPSTQLRYFPPRRPVRFFAKSLIGTYYDLYMDKQDTLIDVKLRFSKKESFIPQYFWYKGRRLQDRKTLEHYNISEGCTIFEDESESEDIYLRQERSTGHLRALDRFSKTSDSEEFLRRFGGKRIYDE